MIGVPMVDGEPHLNREGIATAMIISKLDIEQARLNMRFFRLA